MTYLAEIVEEAVKELLPGVIRGMIYISKVAKVCASEGRFVNWVNPTGFPVSNRYQVPNTLTLKLPDDGPGISTKSPMVLFPVLLLKKNVFALVPRISFTVWMRHY